jgi:predicted CopG family antitoxin
VPKLATWTITTAQEATMKTLTVQVPDDVYERVERRAAARGTSLGEVVVDLLERLHSDQDDARLAAARKRMAELFRTVQGFRLTPTVLL